MKLDNSQKVVKIKQNLPENMIAHMKNRKKIIGLIKYG